MLFPATVLLETDAHIRDFIVARVSTNRWRPLSSTAAWARSAREEPGVRGVFRVAAPRRLTYRYASSPGDSSIGMNIAYHELMNGGGS